jgi:hypothetical protein
VTPNYSGICESVLADICYPRNLPVGAAAFILLFIFLKLPKSYTNRGIGFWNKIKLLDFPGIALIIGAVFCLVLALQWGGQEKPWNSRDIIGLLIGAALLLIAFCAVKWYQGEKATIPWRVFR